MPSYDRMIFIFAIFYICMGIYTSNKSYDRYFEEYKKEYCQTMFTYNCLDDNNHKTRIEDNSTSIAIFSGIFWPIYYIVL